jgi:hypothetical protein
MSKKPQTEYERQKEIWYKKLADSGFVDIEENNGNDLKHWDGSGSTRHDPDYIQAKQEYYNVAMHFLTNHKFDSELEKVIWEYHSNAVSARNISKTLVSAGFVKMGRMTVWRVIKRLRSAMKRLYVNE